MFRYKSIKTYETLKSIKPKEPDIMYGELGEIDKKFKDYQDKYKQKIFPDTEMDNVKQIFSFLNPHRIEVCFTFFLFGQQTETTH